MQPTHGGWGAAVTKAPAVRNARAGRGLFVDDAGNVEGQKCNRDPHDPRGSGSADVGWSGRPRAAVPDVTLLALSNARGEGTMLFRLMRWALGGAVLLTVSGQVGRAQAPFQQPLGMTHLNGIWPGS